MDWEIDSAGTSAHNPGCDPHHLSQKVARKYGIRLEHKCRHFTKADMDRFDKIYVMDEENYYEVKRIAGNKWNNDKVDYLLNELYPGKDQTIFDPWYGGEDGFHEVYGLIDKACDAIIRKYGTLKQEHFNSTNSHR